MRVCSLLVTLMLIAVPQLAESASSEDAAARVTRILQRTPLVDGHNDLPWEIRERFHGKLSGIDLGRSTAELPRSDEHRRAVAGKPSALGSHPPGIG